MASKIRLSLVLLAVMGLVGAAAAPAHAQLASPQPAPAPATPAQVLDDPTGPGNGPDVAVPETSGNPAVPQVGAQPTPSIQSSLGRFGDPGGLRAYLEAKGITYQFIYTGEVLGNPTGGVKQGATYEGIVFGQADVDLEKLLAFKGLTFHASGYQIHGRGLSGNNIQDFFVVSNIEAYPDELLFEAWFEQKLFNDKVSVRVGQLAADTEFAISQTATLFMSATFGWPSIYANDLPSGGPAYPIATPGLRLKVEPIENVAFLAALLNGDPAGAYVPGQNNIITQLRDPGGLDFRLRDPPLLITSAQYAYNQEKESKYLPGTVKIGYLHHFEQFAATDVPGINYRGNDSVYAVLDQTIYREKGTEDQGAAIFLRASAAPSDRNLFDVYLDGGISYKGLLPGRSDDTVGVAAAYGRISPDVRRNDLLSGMGALSRDYQALIEVAYQIAVLPGFTLQPDFQYVIHPGADSIPDPTDGLPARNAAVFGLRTTIVY